MATIYNFKSVNKDIRVSHYAQIPCEPFSIVVKYNKQDSTPVEVKVNDILNIIAKQHLYLNDVGIIPDYCNVITVEIQNENGEWEDYYNEDEDATWEDMCENFLNDTLKNDIIFEN